VKVLVLGGAGAVCKETTRDLAIYSDFENITIADNNIRAVDKLLSEIGDERLTPLYFDADQAGSQLELISDFDIVINGLPYKYDYVINKLCVEAGVNGLDLSSSDPQFELHGQAVDKHILFVPGMGATPGITNMMVRRASEVLDTVDEVDVFFAAFRCLAPSPGLLQTTLWEFNPEEEDRSEVFYENGKWHAAPPLSGEIAVRFHDQIGIQKVYYVPHDESYTLPRSFSGLRRVAVRGCFPPHVMSLMGSLMQSGMLSSKDVNLRGMKIPSIEIINAILLQNPFSKENPVWAYGLVVEVSGTRDQRLVKCVYRSHHPPAEKWGGESAYYKNVGIPLSIGAQLIASGKAMEKGVLPPEKAFPTDLFFNALAVRGIGVEEQIIETGILTDFGRSLRNESSR
jgi:lysine 6-dehydrogenase